MRGEVLLLQEISHFSRSLNPGYGYPGGIYPGTRVPGSYPGTRGIARRASYPRYRNVVNQCYWKIPLVNGDFAAEFRVLCRRIRVVGAGGYPGTGIRALRKQLLRCQPGKNFKKFCAPSTGVPQSIENEKKLR
eukprot:1027894-Rhodomonas_salina.1